MRQVTALVLALVGIGGAVAMFLVKTDETVVGGGAFGNGVRHVHPAWATAVGVAFLLIGLGLAAFALLARGESTRVS
jgi:protein-S-isoprenylcysteine O-methyltransferase Ste14